MKKDPQIRQFLCRSADCSIEEKGIPSWKSDALSIQVCSLFPVLQLRKILIILALSYFFRGVVRVRHMGDEKLEQPIFRFIGKCPVGVTPPAVFLIVASVWFPAYHVILAQRHPAALAY